jgi:hypothetical protein
MAKGNATGSEHFYLTVHSDTTRVMRAFTRIPARGVQINVVLRADANFRPIDAYVSIFSGAKLKGVGFYSVDGDQVNAQLTGIGGHRTRTTTVPAKFSLVTHPLALDGWHSWYAREDTREAQPLNVYFIDGDSRAAADSMLGSLRSLSIMYVGEEVVTVPAGSFATKHYRIVGMADFWVTGPDRLLVRYKWPTIDRMYELTSLRTGTGETAFTDSKGDINR